MSNILQVTDFEYFSYIKKYIAINRIKRQWFKTTTNPIYTLCKKRLLKEFYELYDTDYNCSYT
jgi:hypothetical protein